MKKLLVYIAVLGIVLTSAYSYGGVNEQYRDWVIDFYNHGLAGNDCDAIYDDKGIQGRKFNKENSKFIMSFIKACQAGNTDNTTGQNSLIQILDEWDSNNGGV